MAEVSLRTVRTDRLTVAELEAVARVFDATYREADTNYLEKSRAALRFVALAELEGEVVGFSFGDSVRTELPRLSGPQSVALAGIGCLLAGMQRQGLFGRLELAAMRGGDGVAAEGPFLLAGRMAHVVTYRTMAKMSPTTVPAPGKAIQAWHREIGTSIAEIFGVEIDPATLVVQGSGTPVGFPRTETTLSAGEQELFAAVDRSRGDSLFSMCWLPDAPADWCSGSRNSLCAATTKECTSVVSCFWAMDWREDTAVDLSCASGSPVRPRRRLGHDDS